MPAIPALGRLSSLHELITQLLENLPEQDCNQSFLAGLPSAGWLYGRSIYLETYWLRERILGDDNLTSRVRDIFSLPWQAEKDSNLPPRDHLLNWALEIQDHHLSLLANPGTLPAHSWLNNGWLASYLALRHAQTYEQMLAVLTARALSLNANCAHQVREPLQAAIEPPDAIEVSQGHYRVGAKEAEACFDNELPTQVVMLHNYRICKRPVSNAEFLFFLQRCGYENDAYWEDAGRAWKNAENIRAPWHWRQDPSGHWYGIGLNGPMDLAPDLPVSGISWHEAQAFANFVARELPDYQGAILPHEYQWETAARIQGMSDRGRMWEWCGSRFVPYDQYEQPADKEMRSDFNFEHRVRRGGCLHSQPELRRASQRLSGAPEDRHLFTGLRLVLPPALEQDALYIEQWKKLLQ